MKSILFALLFVSLLGNAQDSFNGFVPFKLEYCGQTYINARPEMIAVMKSHVGDYIPPLDLTGDGWVTVIDVITLLTYQQGFFWSPPANCISGSNPNYFYTFLCGGAMPNPIAGQQPVPCGASSFTVGSIVWQDFGLIATFETTQYPIMGQIKWTYAK